MTKEFILYCDESITKGKYYSDFYGGVLIRSEHFDRINTHLEQIKAEASIFEEIKWTKTNAFTLSAYQRMMDAFFALIADDVVKVRIMFRQSAHEALNLTAEQRESGYFLLYYQFIKHAFGFQFSNPLGEPIYLRTYFDELPDNALKCENFKNQIYALQSLWPFKKAHICIRRDDIVEVNSKHHILLQCLDVVLGAMAFRLNDGHKQKEPGQRQRGKRTIAKEKLYKHINTLIRQLYPNFNVGISTGTSNGLVERWTHPYRHWQFIPKDFMVHEDRFK
jgi:hypothetical protein